MHNKPQVKNRINFLDEARGLDVFCMIFYHAFFMLGSFFEWEWADALFDFFMPVEPFFAGIFIFICGISCTLSRNNFKRGAILLAIALGLTFVTAVVMPALGFEKVQIYFGILHFLSVSIIIYALLKKPLGRVSPFAGVLLCAVLYAFTSGISRGELSYGELISFSLPESLYKTDILMPLGIYSPGFFSADYFPIFPDIFIFLAGAFTGAYCVKNGFPKWSIPQRVPFFGFLGRNALVIYIAHMPIIFALAYGAELIINLFK